MKGRHHILIETARLKYEFEIKRNITIIKGDSATGKTTLISLLQAYSVTGERSGVRLVSDVPCVVYAGDNDSWKSTLSGLSASIVFFDEDYSFVLSRDFSEVIQNTDNYYVFITRRDLVNLPYSINEIYGIRTSGKFHFPERIFNEFYHFYPDIYRTTKIEGPVLLTEDSRSGFQFFSRICEETVCISADGNSNVLKKISECNPEKGLVVIADGAAFGAYISGAISAAELRGDTMLYFPESFEWLILRSGAAGSRKISEILDSPEKYIESRTYFSWEQYFTDLLKRSTVDDPVKKYNKSELPDYYSNAQVSEKILDVLPEDIRKYLK